MAGISASRRKLSGAGSRRRCRSILLRVGVQPMVGVLNFGQGWVGILPGIEKFAISSLGTGCVSRLLCERGKAIEREAGFGPVFEG